MDITAYFDTAAQTVEVFPAVSSRRIARVENVKSEGQAKAALTRRGFTVNDTDTTDYPYGTKFTGKAAR